MTNLSRMNSQDGYTGFRSWRRELDLAVNTSGTQKSGIKNVYEEHEHKLIR
jgi:hypothetical protein